ncbi:unnamed protein product, partial [Urochloa humidicola]
RTRHASYYLLLPLFSVDCSVHFCREEEAAPTMDEPSQSEDRKLSAVEHVKKRHQEKGFLYACAFMFCCCFCCYEACEHCLECFCCCGKKDE